MNTLRIASQPFAIAVSSEKSKSWTDKHIAGRFQPATEFDKFTNLPDQVIAEYLALVGDDSDEATAARTALMLPYAEKATRADSPIAFDADDLVGWMRLAGSPARAHALLGAGVLAIPDGDDTLAKIEAAFALIGVDLASIVGDSDDDDSDDDSDDDAPDK